MKVFVSSLIVALSLVSLSVIAIVASQLAGSGSAGTAQANHSSTAGQVDFLSIDMDPTSNPANGALGTREDCAELTGVEDTIDIDVTIDEVDPADLLKGFQFTLTYDNSIVKIIGVNDLLMLGVEPISGLPGGYALGTDAAFTFAPDTDGKFRVSRIDLGNPDFGSVHESGAGVLARITLEAVGTGTTPLNLQYVNFPPPGGLQIKIFTDGDEFRVDTGEVINVQNAALAVGEPCVVPTPTPAPPTANVVISFLDCNSNPEVVKIKNTGTASQNLAGWELRSDPVADQVKELTPVGSLDPGEEVSIFSDQGAPDTNPAAGEFLWIRTEQFRDGDTTDFVQLFERDVDFPVDQVKCTELQPTPGVPTSTPTPSSTSTPTPTPVPTALPLEQLPSTGVGGDGGGISWPVIALGIVGALLVASATGSFAVRTVRRRRS